MAGHVDHSIEAHERGSVETRSGVIPSGNEDGGGWLRTLLATPYMARLNHGSSWERTVEVTDIESIEN